MDLTTYITQQALVLIPVLYIIGYIIKKSQINDKYIPILLMVIGVTFAMAALGASVESAIQGILVAGTAVLGNQVYRQMSDK